MRTTITAVIISCFITSSAAAAGLIQPLIDSGEPAARTSSPVFDRSYARELGRLSAPIPTPRHIIVNLRQEASVQSLQHPIVLTGRHDDAAAQLAGKIVVTGATTLRLHIIGSAPGAVLWLAGENDAEFERFDPTETATWTPTTRGPVVYIATQGAGEGITIQHLAIGTPQTNGAASVCLRDATCSASGDVAELADASRAIALIRFVRGDASYVCTGGLINDMKGSRTPFLLTAHHCINSAEEAASIEAVWDDRSASCGSSQAADTRTRTYGATLLVSSAATDVALLRLNKIPANRVFLGVELSPLGEGTMTYRLSHADGAMQKYSAGVVRASGAGCPLAPRPYFIYSRPASGAVSMGSSGAPLLIPGLRIAGQLLGLCGASPADPCATYNEFVDGSITASWPLLAPYLDPPANPRRRAAHS